MQTFENLRQLRTVSERVAAGNYGRNFAEKFLKKSVAQ